MPNRKLTRPLSATLSIATESQLIWLTLGIGCASGIFVWAFASAFYIFNICR